MAEIKIRKKRPVWIWVVLLLIITGVVYYLWATGRESVEDDMPTIESNEQGEGMGINYFEFHKAVRYNDRLV